METPCLCPFEGHKYGHSQKSGTASGIHRRRIIRLNQNGGQGEEKFCEQFFIIIPVRYYLPPLSLFNKQSYELFNEKKGASAGRLEYQKNITHLHFD